MKLRIRLFAASVRLMRRTAVLVMVSQVLATAPLLTEETARAVSIATTTIAREVEQKVAEARAPKVRVNRTVPKVVPPSADFLLSEDPSDAELMKLRIFAEPLLPFGRPSMPGENAALSSALRQFAAHATADQANVLLAFVDQYADSPWKPSLLANVAALYARAGYFSKALSLWSQAWDIAKRGEGANVNTVAAYAIGEWLNLATKFGKVPEIEAKLAETEGFSFSGTAAARVSEAREGVNFLKFHHHEAMFSGPEAIKAWLQLDGQLTADIVKRVNAQHTDISGTTLAQLRELAQSVGLATQIVHIRNGSIPVPSIAHLRSQHFSAVIRAENDGYVLRDAILGGELWLSRQALSDEASGYFLVRTSSERTGRPVGAEEARTVVGHCAPGNASIDDDEFFGAGEPPSCGMPIYRFQPVSASVVIEDTPLNCSTPRGPSVAFKLVYNHRDFRHPQTPTYGNVGQRWTHNWLSYVTDNNSGVGPPATWTTVFLRGHGREWYSSSTLPAQHQITRATLVKVSHDPPRYERRLKDGSVEVFTVADRAASLPGRRVFLSEFVDLQGQSLQFSYDASFRLVAMTDALGRVSTLSYENASDPMKITKVTDPFGRFTRLEYNSAGQLTSITDAIGMTSTFSYGSNDFIVSMTTPYGTTTFRDRTDTATIALFRQIEATDPLGGTERLEFRWSTAAIPATAPSNQVPVGFEDWNQLLDHYNTLYWDRRAMALYPGDVSKATVINWLHAPDMPGSGHPFSRTIPHSYKRPLEHRVWFRYSNQNPALHHSVGLGREPTIVAQVTDDGSTAAWQATYNTLGLPTLQTDPLGRQTSYDYAANDLDLLEVRQTSSGINHVLASFGNYTPTHQPQSATDAAGEVSSFTYNSHGQILTFANARSETTTYAYDTANDGYLISVVGPVSAATVSFTYDAFGRRRTVSDPDGYSVTLDYDALDRRIKVTYPDTTFEQATYDRLHVAQTRDRLGRVTRLVADAAGRVIAVQDPLGRTTQYNWCACGQLDAFIDAKGQKTSWTRDVQGRVTQELRADSATVTAYTYEAATGRLKTVTDPKAQVKTYTYNRDDSVQSVVFTNTSVATPPVSYTYDTAYHRLATMSDGIGTTTYTYKAPGELGAPQLATVDGPLTNDTMSYAYDEVGRVTQRLLDGSGTTFTYDILGRVSTLTHAIGTFAYSYLGQGARLANLTYPNGQVSAYTYLPNSADRRLQTLHHRVSTGGTTLSKFDYTYDVIGNIVTWRQERAGESPFSYDFRYDAADQLTAAVKKSTDPTPTILARQAWGYDAAGNRTTDQHNDAVVAATLDSLNRLGARSPGGSIVFAGTVNETASVTVAGRSAIVDVDNEFRGVAPVSPGTSVVTLTATDASGNVTTKAYEVDTDGATTTYTYDANGNLAGDGTRTYNWNARNQLVSVQQSGVNVVTFVYDGFGRRVNKTSEGGTRTYIYDVDDMVEERSGTDVIRFVHGPGIDNVLAKTANGGSPTYFLADHLGSIVQETNGIGQVTLTREYDPWGAPIQGLTVSGYAFTGRVWDAEVGFYDYRRRVLDPALGRFISPEPLGVRVDSSLYAYVGSNPLSWIDPSGLIKLPNDPSQLPPEWKPDPTHRDPNGQRFRHPNGKDFLDFHKGREGERGWRGKDHWHHNGGDEHHVPGTEVPDPEPSNPKPEAPDNSSRFQDVPTLPPWAPWVVAGGMIILACIFFPEVCVAVVCIP